MRVSTRVKPSRSSRREDGAADEARDGRRERSIRRDSSKQPHHPFSIFFFKALRNALAVARKTERLAVQKTYKLYVGGKFVRSESGRVAAARERGRRSWPIMRALRAKIFAMRCVAARKRFAGWAKQSAYLRGQILYRAAEMLEMRRPELEAEVARANGAKAKRDDETHARDRSAGALRGLDG